VDFFVGFFLGDFLVVDFAVLIAITVQYTTLPPAYIIGSSELPVRGFAASVERLKHPKSLRMRD
jgi:hypothetical protein